MTQPIRLGIFTLFLFVSTVSISAQTRNFVQLRLEVGAVGLENIPWQTVNDPSRFEEVTPGPAFTFGVEKNYYIAGIDKLRVSLGVLAHHNTYSRFHETFVRGDLNSRGTDRQDLSFRSIHLSLPINFYLHYKKVSISAGVAGVVHLLSRVNEKFEALGRVDETQNFVSHQSYGMGSDITIAGNFQETVRQENTLDGQYMVGFNYAVSPKLTLNSQYRGWWSDKNPLIVETTVLNTGNVSEREFETRSNSVSVGMLFTL